jgi:hypothetical protein
MSRPYESRERSVENDRGSNGERRVGEALSTGRRRLRQTQVSARSPVTRTRFFSGYLSLTAVSYSDVVVPESILNRMRRRDNLSWWINAMRRRGSRTALTAASNTWYYSW